MTSPNRSNQGRSGVAAATQAQLWRTHMARQVIKLGVNTTLANLADDYKQRLASAAGKGYGKTLELVTTISSDGSVTQAFVVKKLDGTHQVFGNLPDALDVYND